MPLSPSFSVSESLANPNELTFVDTSTGSDGTIVNRRIYFKLANGNWLTENGQSTTGVYTNWPYSDNSIILSLLQQSTAADITVEWWDNSTAVYSVSNTFCFNIYDYLFGLQLLQGNTSSPNQVQDSAYYSNLMQFIVNIFNEESAIDPGEDIFSSQGAMTRNLLFINNETFSF